MCGSATFAMEVSSTSMNVASVTVTAITQGLIVPDGILSLARILFRIALGSQSLLVLRTTALFVSLNSFLICNYRRIHVHSWPQHRFLLRGRIQHDLHRYPLHHLHVISRRVFRRQQAKHGSRRPGNRIHAPADCPSFRTPLPFCSLPALLVPQLLLFEFPRPPPVLQRPTPQQPFPRLHDLSRLHLFVQAG